MLIRRFSRLRRWIVAGLILPLLMLLLDVRAYAAEVSGDEIRVENPKIRTEGDTIFISYDLVAPVGHEYRVRVVLLRGSDPSFEFVPTSVSGDIGKGVAAGAQKEIRWDYTHDFPRGLNGTDFTFNISAEEIGSNSWLYYVAGAVLAGGATALLLLKKGGANGSQNVILSLPPPPTRPG